MEAKKINALIRNRRSRFPSIFTDKKVEKSVIWELLKNANAAPNHRKTEPWRFVVFHSEASRKDLGLFMAETYKERAGTDFKAIKYNKIQKKCLQAGAILAIVMQRDPEKRVPEWEELCAVACAVQNIWLSLDAYELGGYWSTPKFITGEETKAYLDLEPGQTCYGVFYLGHYEPIEMPLQRGDITKKISWK